MANKTAASAALTGIGAIGMPAGEAYSRRGSYNPVISHHETKNIDVKPIDDWHVERESPLNEREKMEKKTLSTLEIIMASLKGFLTFSSSLWSSIHESSSLLFS